MINSFHNIRGAAILIMTVILLVVSSLIIIFAANFSVLQGKSINNVAQNNQALAAADAGIEFGIVYLNKNATTILASPVSGFIAPYSDSNTTNVTLANNSKFSVVYTNPVAGNYNLILITSTGVSSSGDSTRVVSQQVQFGSLLVSPSSSPLVTQGNVTLSGNSNITNTHSNSTITSGGTVTISGSSTTTVSGGTGSSAGAIGSDVQSNNTSVGNMSQSDYFSTYFGNTSNGVKASMAHVYSNTTSTNYSSTLSGMTGTSIWIDQTSGTASINGSTTIGSPSNPVLLIVNGNFSLSGNVTIYGYIFVFGTNTIESIAGNVTISGAISAVGNLTMSGSSVLTYDSSVINNLQNLPSMRYFAKVPGTWRDF